MRVRFSMVSGTQVVDDDSQQVLGKVNGIFLHPDSGQVLGFFVRAASFLGGQLFLSTSDIRSWGLYIHVRSPDALSPPEELVRIQPLLSDPRRILGQTIVTEKKRLTIGTCHDVQFNTRTFTLEWIFPKRFFFWRIPIPANRIVEVTRDAIIVREPEGKERAKEEAAPAKVAIPEVQPA